MIALEGWRWPGGPAPEEGLELEGICQELPTLERSWSWRGAGGAGSERGRGEDVAGIRLPILCAKTYTRSFGVHGFAWFCTVLRTQGFR
jgi:hypothetical protein